MEWLRLALGLALMFFSTLLLALSLLSLHRRAREQEDFHTKRRVHFTEAHDFGVPFDEKAFQKIVEEFSRSDGSD
ncbi:hypothetical protein [Actinocorallia longicatena]|uniref:Uncharacterized protein n=1 Tax=Actinocorallia longicatena TaxID=111803 RepID=A0ABP6Q6J4_9ACTN